MAFAVDEFPYSSEYDSDLRSVLKTIREVMATLKTYDEAIAELKQELANIQGLYDRVAALENATADLDEIRTKVSNLITDLEALTNKEKADVSNLQKQVDAIIYSITDIEKKIRDMYSYIDYNVANLERSIKKEVEYLMKAIAELDTKLSKQIEYILWRLDKIDTSVLNPWHSNHGRVDQDKNAKFIYFDLADNELTAEEYSRLGLTADSYSALGISAYDYARRGKQVLHYYWVYNPVKGWRQEVSNVLTAICNYCKDTLTATEYADLNMSADAYSNLRLTAKDYYEFNPAHVGLYEKDGTLQSRQFDLIEENGVLIIQRGTSTETDGVLSVEA